jgi:hypothetical protein
MRESERLGLHGDRAVTSSARSLLTALSAQVVAVAATAAGGLRVGSPRHVVLELTPKLRDAKADLLAELRRQTPGQRVIEKAEVEERAALAADSVPTNYLDAWARLQCQRPPSIAESDWQRAIDDAGRFLDAWGANAATMQWTTAELFGVSRKSRPGGLFWQLKGERVTALDKDRAQLADGRTISRGARRP